MQNLTQIVLGWGCALFAAFGLAGLAIASDAVTLRRTVCPPARAWRVVIEGPRFGAALIAAAASFAAALELWGAM